MNSPYPFGRSISQRIAYIARECDEDERKILEPFVIEYQKTLAGSFNIDSNTTQNNIRNTEALRKIDEIFFNKYGQHIVDAPAQIGLDRWP